MSELVERLRTHFADCPPKPGERSFTRELLDEAADRIEALEARCERYREALEVAEDTLERVTFHKPGTPGLSYDSERQLAESAAGIAESGLGIVRAALEEAGNGRG